MTTKIIDCHIRIGCKAKNPRAAVERAAERHGAVDWTGWEIVCGDRTCRMSGGTGSELSVGMDLKTVSCSNCYGDDVWLTKIRLQIPDRWEVDGSEGPGVYEVLQNSVVVCSREMGLTEAEARNKVENEKRMGIHMVARLVSL